MDAAIHWPNLILITMRDEGSTLSPIYKWANWGSESLSNLPRISKTDVGLEMSTPEPKAPLHLTKILFSLQEVLIILKLLLIVFSYSSRKGTKTYIALHKDSEHPQNARWRKFLAPFPWREDCIPSPHVCAMGLVMRRKRQWKESTLATTLLCSYLPDYLRILIQPDYVRICRLIRRWRMIL